MEQNDLGVGRVVQSTMGRDKGKYFIVLDKTDDQHVVIADGYLRRVERPKKKKIKHLLRLDLISGEIHKSILESKKISNAFVRKELERLGFKPKAKNGGSVNACPNKM